MKIHRVQSRQSIVVRVVIAQNHVRLRCLVLDIQINAVRRVPVDVIARYEQSVDVRARRVRLDVDSVGETSARCPGNLVAGNRSVQSADEGHIIPAAVVDAIV